MSVKPSAAYFSAIACPMPRPPPVITQIFPGKNSKNSFCRTQQSRVSRLCDGPPGRPYVAWLQNRRTLYLAGSCTSRALGGLLYLVACNNESQIRQGRSSSSTDHKVRKVKEGAVLTSCACSVFCLIHQAFVRHTAPRGATGSKG